MAHISARDRETAGGRERGDFNVTVFNSVLD